ncbi:MAG: hypothetical protein HY721_26720 [Planctomycetes bacterium]|nr:hypothetical protein [Planctomycetota bacterium]
MKKILSYSSGTGRPPSGGTWRPRARASRAPCHIYLLQYLFQRGPVIPQPFPEAGPDPTPDELECAG